MGEKVQVAATKPEVRKENLASKSRNADQSQSMSSPIDQILYLQRTIGNQAVQRLIKSGALQAKLKVGQPGNKYEQEADRVADEVMRMPEPQVQWQPIEDEEEEQIQTKPAIEQITPLVQKQVEKEEEELVQTKPVAEQITPSVQRQTKEDEEELLQTKRLDSQSHEIMPSLATRIESMKGGGHPLPESTRSFFEPRFGHDFNQVRVHTDTRIAEIAQAVNARAFTVGRNIAFGPGQYTPESQEGRKLLAHELMHVVQQRQGGRAARWLQRQHVHMATGRYVGDLPGTSTNLREDVLRVMDQLHYMWSINNSNYNVEYPVVGARPPRSHIAAALIPKTIAAIRRNEQPVLHPGPAHRALSITISASVGRGQLNRRTDILHLLHALHRHWHLSNPDYSIEFPAVRAGPDPVREADITAIIRGITQMKVAFVSGRWRGTGGVLRGTRRISAAQSTQVRVQLTPGVPPGMTFRDLVGGRTYRQRLEQKLNQLRNRWFPQSRRLLTGSQQPMSRFEQIAAEAKRRVDRVFGSYARGTTLTSARGNLVDLSTIPPYAADLLDYLINEDNNFTAIRTLHGADNSRAARPTYTVPPAGVTTIAQVAAVNHTRPANIAAINVGVGTSVVPGQVLNLPYEPDIVAALIAAYLSIGTNRHRFEVIERAWPGAEMNGRVGIQRYAGTTHRQRRINYWRAFQILIHEYLHTITHPNYTRVAYSLGRVQKGVLVEGGTSLFTDDVWRSIYPTVIRTDVTLRSNVEGRIFSRNLSLIPTIAHYSSIIQARAIQTIVRPPNMRAAYFLGRTELLGLIGPNRYTVPPSGIRTVADVAFMTGRTADAIARANPPLRPFSNVAPGTTLTLP